MNVPRVHHKMDSYLDDLFGPIPLPPADWISLLPVEIQEDILVRLPMADRVNSRLVRKAWGHPPWPEAKELEQENIHGGRIGVAHSRWSTTEILVCGTAHKRAVKDYPNLYKYARFRGRAFGCVAFPYWGLRIIGMNYDKQSDLFAGAVEENRAGVITELARLWSWDGDLIALSVRRITDPAGIELASYLAARRASGNNPLVQEALVEMACAAKNWPLVTVLCNNVASSSSTRRHVLYTSSNERLKRTELKALCNAVGITAADLTEDDYMALVWMTFDTLKWYVSTFNLGVSALKSRNNALLFEAAETGNVDRLEWLSDQVKYTREELLADDRVILGSGMGVLLWLADTYDIGIHDAQSVNDFSNWEMRREYERIQRRIRDGKYN